MTVQATQSVPLPAASGAWWLPALSPAERDALPPGRTPRWAESVEHALRLAESAPGGRIRSIPGTGPEGRLLHPLRPFLLTASRHFAAANPAAADRRVVWAGARHHLAGGLVRLAGRTLVQELGHARRAGTLTGQDGRERFDAFLRQVAAGPALGAVLHRHPVLARLLAERCMHTVAAATELLKRLHADREQLTAALLDGEPGRLTRVRFGLGDPHAAGRSVAVLEFDGGQHLVYKPRPLGLHARWNELLAWFDGRQPRLAARAVRLLPRAGYGWAEYVPPRPCRSRAEVGRFYERLGAQLALLHVVNAVDIHAENLIAARDQPVVVDVETLFHPCWVPVTDGGTDPAARALAASVQRTMVLPNPWFGGGGSLDLSALGGQADQWTPDPMPGWADAGTDLMRLVRRPARWPGADNRPMLAGRPADPADHLDRLLCGFRAGYRAIAAHSHELLGEQGLLSRFAGETMRLVARPSQSYATLLAEATEPELLRDRSGRERAFAALHDETGYPHLHVLAPHELTDLLAGDVPYFTVTPAARTPRTWDGRELPFLLDESGIAAAARTIRGMSEGDLDRQAWLIRASLVAGRRSPGRRAPGRPAGESEDTYDGDLAARALELARGIGEDLLARACRGESRVNWLGLQESGPGQWAVLPMGMALGDGYTGPALFLAELGRLTGAVRYQEAADQAVRALPRLLRLLAEYPELARAVGPGGFSGLGGISYATARLATLLDSPELSAALPAGLAALHTAAVDPAAPMDIADGLAGALLAAEAVHAQTRLPEAAELAHTVRTLAGPRPRPERPGFLHGHEGVAWALRERAAVDLADSDGPGRCPDRAGPVLRAREEDRHLALLADRVPMPDHSLRHGELGPLEPLVELTPTDAGRRRTAARLVRSVAQQGARCGTPGEVPTPGLLTGLAGIGYGLLRLGFGPRIPSVLLLRPAAAPGPVEREEGHHHDGQRTARQSGQRAAGDRRAPHGG
ncbi:type 2 lanthipeptide synthetase LanM family protein [Kitasatospora sp. NPDC058444]|uniref:type 2 lanthipeptide synthetase LanM family protein n=1 Tax=Kitasatospora sp. NPDC058444 TaxID=3346504 RepID=UPI003658BA38